MIFPGPVKCWEKTSFHHWATEKIWIFSVNSIKITDFSSNESTFFYEKKPADSLASSVFESTCFALLNSSDLFIFLYVLGILVDDSGNVLETST